MKSTYNALVNIAQRNYPKDTWPVVNALDEICVASNDDFVFRLKDKSQPTSFTKLFDHYLTEHHLLIDPITGQRRVFYSLRHTYATLALTYDRVPIHTLAKQMGTSVLMIEKHYSHLKVVQAVDQLRREESRQLIAAGGLMDITLTPG
jgi:integrase